jgi:hypothetical protein
MNFEALIQKIESYPFESEGGPLTMCVDWINLKAAIRIQKSTTPPPADAMTADATPRVDSLVSMVEGCLPDCKQVPYFDKDEMLALAKQLERELNDAIARIRQLDAKRPAVGWRVERFDHEDLLSHTFTVTKPDGQKFSISSMDARRDWLRRVLFELVSDIAAAPPAPVFLRK